MTLPNLITIARIFLVPAIVWLLFNHDYVWAFVLFLVIRLFERLKRKEEVVAEPTPIEKLDATMLQLNETIQSRI